MFIGLEIPFLAAFLYPCLNYIWLFPKLRSDLEKEIKHEQQEMDGVEIWDFHNEQDYPIYIHINNLAVPVGGGINKVEKRFISKHISKDKKTEYLDCYQVNTKKDIKLTKTSTSYINTYEAVIKTFKYYNIPRDILAFKLPLKADYYNYKNGLYLHKMGLVASNKEILVKEILWRKRLPLTIVIPSITGVCVAACWFYYATRIKSIYLEPYYPPFHPTRIQAYFNKNAIV